MLEKHLVSEHGAGGGSSSPEYLVGNKCTIADIALWGWVAVSRWAGVELEGQFPLLMAWEERMLARPAVERGRHVPEKHVHRDLLRDPKAMAEFEKRAKNFYRQKEAEAEAAAGTTTESGPNVG